MKQCVLQPDRSCIECGDCNICDLDPNKQCDNCCKCIERDGKAPFAHILVEDIAAVRGVRKRRDR